MLDSARASGLFNAEGHLEHFGHDHFLELMRQGSAGLLRVEAAARILQNQAHRTSVLSKAALGALYDVADDPVRLYASPDWADLPQKLLRRNRVWWDDSQRELMDRIERPPMPQGREDVKLFRNLRTYGGIDGQKKRNLKRETDEWMRDDLKEDVMRGAPSQPYKRKTKTTRGKPSPDEPSPDALEAGFSSMHSVCSATAMVSSISLGARRPCSKKDKLRFFDFL